MVRRSVGNSSQSTRLPVHHPASVQKKLENIEDLLRTHCVLLILDDVELSQDQELEIWIQQLPETSRILLTCKPWQTRDLWSIYLNGLDEAAALQLIHLQAHRLELAKVGAASDAELRLLVRATKRNPKAIEMALGHLKYGTLSLHELVEQLNSADMTVGNIFDYLFRGAWDILSDDHSARYLLVISAFFRDSASKTALAALPSWNGLI